MKTTGLFFLVGTVVVAGKIPSPDISIGLNFDHDTAEGSLGAAVPQMTWASEEISIADLFDVQGGFDSTLTNIRKPPVTNIWGEAKRFFSDAAVAIRGDMNANEAEVLNLNVRVNAFDNAAGVQLLGAADLKSKSVGFHTLLGATSVNEPLGMPGKVMVNPKYDLVNKVPDAMVGYFVKDTSLNCNVRQQKFSLSQVFGKTKIAPTISTKTKDVSIVVARQLPEGSVSTTITPKDFSVTYARGNLATTFKPNDSLEVQWSDGSWDATIVAPLDGYFPEKGNGVKLSMKRNVGVSLF
mmetsp:Transcript_21278/g.43763  ORF Transcript_21278/g.43763 Transcript_21278/m.43763 type:complete len:296 (-) Transcript_21278:70-957(-)